MIIQNLHLWNIQQWGYSVNLAGLFRTILLSLTRKVKSILRRETKADVVLISKLKPALKKINPNISETVLDEAVKIFTSDRSLMGMVSANRKVFDLLKNGILVSYPNNKNEYVSERVQIIDWVNIENNDFFLASQCG